tara:strand:- start:680 stop:886 length:207 start_codon:yes stop_codon:yes gene_type:complete
MKVGDLVRVVQSKKDDLVSPFTGEVGVIVASQLERFKSQDSFSVIIRNKFHTFGANYLELVDKDRSDK